MRNVFDVTGRLVLTLPISTKENNLKIDVRSLNKSVYFLVIGDYKQKFIRE
ncbi:T9SS type A sorting domain-containing protein [Chryseobacterium sp. PET-29]|uniref:T9SS type A sorting domain-containing protein n=1 Tax=Chryseobacterium sp. PET-29 TaxID=2983267 RepID=UPI00398F936C